MRCIAVKHYYTLTIHHLLKSTYIPLLFLMDDSIAYSKGGFDIITEPKNTFHISIRAEQKGKVIGYGTWEDGTDCLGR